MSKAHPEFSAPIILMHEVDGFNVSIELKTGELYSGTLNGSEDNFNCHLTNVTYTNLEGVNSHLDSVYIRGSNILFMVIPNMFANAPTFTGQVRVAKGHAEGFAGNLRDKQTAFQMRYKWQ